MNTSFNYPLLSRVAALYEKVKLEDVLLLASQHLLEPQERMFEHLFEMGLQPINCVIAGKSYSTNQGVMENLIAKGCIVAPFSLDFDPLQSFDEWYEKSLNEFIKQQLIDRSFADYSKVIILDDGGFLHLVVNGLDKDFSNVIGIEQTSSGHHRINNVGIDFESISVARSYHKLRFESPYIGEDGVARVVKHSQSRNKVDPKILVTGLGPIGRQIAGRLFYKHSINVQAIDPAIDNNAASFQRFGLRLLESHNIMIPVAEAMDRLSEYDIIVGATGDVPFVETSINDFHEEVSLISISSSDREFPVLQFRRQGGNLHDDYYLEQRCLVNGGFPITFDGKPNALPPDQIELTIALLMVRLLDAVGTEYPMWLAYTVGQIYEMWKVRDEVMMSLVRK